MAPARRRLLLASAATLVVLAPLAWFWQQSRMPATYSITDMGYADYGGGTRPTASDDMAGMHHGTSVTELVADADRTPDVTVELVARQQRFDLASGRSIDGFTFNGTSPGPQITAEVGQLVEVRVRNESVERGITVHWHGVDVPNGEDGVAGVTQDAIGKGEDFTYRFVPDHPGTYWYHSHQLSNTQVRRGLFGALVVLPAEDDDRLDVTAVAHTYEGVRTLNGKAQDARVDAPARRLTRVRVVNTDNGTLRVWADSSYRVLAVDGYDVNEPTPIEGKGVDVPAGGRVDVEVTAPARVHVGVATAVAVGNVPPGRATTPRDAVDLLSYGSTAALPFDPAHADRHFRYSISRKPGFIDGRPGYWWSVDGHLWPDVPMFVVEEGDVVVMRVESHSGTHPMHLHGHHAVVLSHNGRKATGSPWWVDSLDVHKGDTFEIAFRADNPGIWLDHCHQLKHASQGLVAHLMYAGVTTPFKLGHDSGNDPE